MTIEYIWDITQLDCVPITEKRLNLQEPNYEG